jgi:membrane protease YdiL (CAAX protease family)
MGTSRSLSQPAVSSNELGDAMRRHPLLSYFSLAYAIKFIVLVPYTLAAWRIISGDWTAAFVIATFGPFAAGIVMVNLTEGRAGLSRLWKSIWQWRVGWQWLLFVFAGIPALVMFGILIQPGALVSFQGLTPHIVVFLLVSYPLNYVLIWFAGGGLDEEVGWRGFALPIMQTRYGPLWGTLLLGVLHCFWHLEEFLTPAQGGGPGTGWTQFATNLPIFLLFVLSVNLIITWVFNHTRGSLFAVTSLHASVDAPQAALMPLFPALGVTQAGVSTTSMILGFTVGLGVVALLIVILTRGQLGYQPLRSPQSSEP